MKKRIHGGDVYSQNVKYDFSANINPLGLPDVCVKAVIENISEIEKYPDVNCTKLKEAYCKKYGISSDRVVFGNGAADIIYRLVQVIAPKRALIAVPTFTEYERALRSFGCSVEYVYYNEQNDFVLDNSIFEKIPECDIAFICRPNNPVGNIIDQHFMGKIIEKCKQENTRLVVDECFMDFVENSEKYALKTVDPNLIILRAFTKIYAMPGIRLGLMICSDEELCSRVELCGQCWSVSSLAQIAGCAALSDDYYIKQTVKYVSCERERIEKGLSALGFKVYISLVNFILFRSNMPLDEVLTKKNIAVRNCSDFEGLDKTYFRIAVRTHDENTILLRELERIVKNG